MIRRFKKTKKFARILYFIISIGYLIGFSFFSKSVISLTGIESLIRYTILLLLFVYLLLYVFICFSRLVRKKYVLFSFLSFLSILFILIFFFSSHIIDLVYEKLSSINEDSKVVYTSNMVTLSNTEFKKDDTIGIINDENDKEGYILAQEIIEKEKLTGNIKKYDSYISLIYALYEKEVKGIFLSSNYVTLFSSEEDFNNISIDTKVVYSFSKEMANDDANIISNKMLSEPFTVLILGVDSTTNGLNASAAFNGDTLMLATINPKTLNATLFSIPRDTYVPISCKKGNKAKINSSAVYGTSCVIDTIENFTGISIDYYVKINFTGVVDLVEAIDGVEIEVEAPNYNINHGHNCGGKVCEQDSKRRWDNYTVYIDPGYQKLNGEQVLAYARCRGLYASSDLARNKHQQDIIIAIAKKMLKVKSYSEFKKVLDAISNNISTNMSMNQILSGYDILKDMINNALDGSEMISIQKSYLEVYNLPVYIERTNRVTSALGYYEDSLNDIVRAMKVNLELEEASVPKTFSYSIKENYESKVSGKGIFTGASNQVLKNFAGLTREDAQKYCNSNNLTCNFVYVDENSEYYSNAIETDKITMSNPRANSLMDNIKEVTFYINGKKLAE